MQGFPRLKCFACSQILSEFVLLSCSHSLCEDCIATRKASSGQFITVTCKCGLTTHVPNNSCAVTGKSSLQKTRDFLSPQRQNTDPGIVIGFSNSRKERSDYLSYANKDDIHIQGESVKYLASELANQIKFLEQKFGRYLNEINRNYIQVVEQYKLYFFRFCKEVKEQCYTQILNTAHLTVSVLSTKISKSFTSKIESRLTKLNKTLQNAAKQIGVISSFTPSKTLKENRSTTQSSLNRASSSGKKSLKTPTHNRHRCSGDIVCQYSRTKIGFQELRQDLKEQKKLLKKTLLMRKPSQLFRI